MSIPTTRKRKPRKSSQYVLDRLDEIREYEDQMLAATAEHPRETKLVRWLRLWNEAVYGKSRMQIHNMGQCSECGGVFLKSEFHMRNRRTHDACKACRGKVNARRKYHTQRDELKRREALFRDRKSGARAKAIKAVRKAWTQRTAQNRSEYKKYQAKMVAGATDPRTKKAMDAHAQLGRYHQAVRKAMQKDFNDPTADIRPSLWYFDDSAMRDAYGIASSKLGQTRDKVSDVYLMRDYKT